MNRDILAVIQENMPTFSKGQRRIANYILESYDKAAFMTASKLGKIVGVSESTVVRFAAELGYDGYPSMQKSLQKMIRRRLNSVQRIEVSNDRIGDHDILSTVLQSDMEKIRLTLEAVDHNSFELSADAIVSARRIYIIGVRSAAAIVTFLSFNMHLIFDNVTTVSTNTVSEIFERLMGELSVPFKLMGAIVNVAVYLIGISLIHERLNERDDLIHHFGDLRMNIGRHDV